MKSRFSLLLGFVLVCCLSLLGFAQSDQQQPEQQQGQQQGMGQGHHHGMPNPDQELAHLTQSLNLTSDQQAKIKPILEDSSKQMQALQQDTSMSQQDRHAKMQDIHKNSMSQIRGTLTPDQQQKFDTMMKSHQGGGHHEGGHGQNPPPTQ
jgi:Spy/CpxP family protein refolding chaperone